MPLNKETKDFSKELCRSSLLCHRYDSACICVFIVGHGYTTLLVMKQKLLAMKHKALVIKKYY